MRAVVWDLGGQTVDSAMFQNYLYGTQVKLLLVSYFPGIFGNCPTIFY